MPGLEIAMTIELPAGFTSRPATMDDVEAVTEVLQHAFREFFVRGERTTGLSTDSRTGALALHEHVGLSVTHSYMHYAMELDG